MPASFSGTPYVEELKTNELGLVIGETSPGESVVLKCIDDTSLRSEIWSVIGGVSGERALKAVSGVQYTDSLGFINFKIPQKFPPAELERFRNLGIDYATRSDPSATLPPVCVTPMHLLEKATPKTLRLVYKKKPVIDTDCNCENANMIGSFNKTCLGTSTGTTEWEYNLTATIKSLLSSLYAYKENFIRLNTDLVYNSGDIIRNLEFDVDEGFVEKWTATLQYDRMDIEAVEQITAIFHEALYAVREHISIDSDYWAPGMNCTLNQIIRPLTPNDHYYKCTQAGVAGGVEPV